MKPSRYFLGSNNKYRISGMIILYLLGIAYWLYFLHAEVPLILGDWMKEQVYANTLREAVDTGAIPWRWSEPYYHGVYEFIANPEISFVPDFLLLHWLSNSSYFSLHTCLFYSIGFYGLIRIARTTSLHPIGVVFFWLVFNFNGYITSHMNEGHTQWTGYFLIPLFFALLAEFDASENQKSFVYPAVMGMLLGLLFINGSLHVAVWCAMFMALAVLWKRDIWPSVGVALVIGGLIGACRLIPGAIYFPKKSGFITGYPDLKSLIDGFTVLREHAFPPIGGVMGDLDWWEFDIYIGFVAFSILLVCGFSSLRQQHRSYGSHFLAAGVVMFLLSMGNVYALVANSVIPFAGVERVSSRFIVMPFVLLLVMASSGIGKIILTAPKQIKTMAALAIVLVTGELYLNLKYWKPNPSVLLESIPVIPIVPNFDKKYETVVYLSWSLSFLVSVAVAIYLYGKIKNNKGNFLA